MSDELIPVKPAPFNTVDRGWDERDFQERFLPILESMTRDRGWIINSYAQLEFLAADLIVKCRAFEDYAELNEKQLPFGIDGRIKRIQELCESGPLAKHAEDLLPLMDHLLELENTRHFFTHGFSSVHIQSDGSRMGLHMRRYVPPARGQKETRSEIIILPEDMTAARTRWTIFAQTAVGIVREIYDSLGLDSHDVTDGYPDRIV